MAILTFPYIGFKAIELPARMQLNARCIRNFCTILFLLLIFILPSTSVAQDTDQDYEEISVFLAVQGVGGYEITAIYKNDQIYLPVSEMFQVLKINQKTSDYNDTISGFFLMKTTNTSLVNHPHCFYQWQTDSTQ